MDLVKDANAFYRINARIVSSMSGFYQCWYAQPRNDDELEVFRLSYDKAELADRVECAYWEWVKREIADNIRTYNY